jgi:ABC-2 type transport system permease protein
VLSKFAVAIVVIPLVALAASLVAQLVVATGGAVRLSISGIPGSIMWQPEALLGGFSVAFLWCVTAMLWYAPIVGYLMLASAWAPRGPFLWAVLPPVGLWVGERAVIGSEFVGDFITGRLFGLYRLLGARSDGVLSESGGEIEKIGNVDLVGSLREFYTSPDLWLGVLAAALLLAGAMWVRRYRDETS